MLGSGGMGEVYRAHDGRLGRDVAIKVLPEQFSKDADRLRRFEQEARATGSLNHPNILAIYDIGTHEGSPYVVSELLEGETLRQALYGQAIPLRRATDYASQVAGGLAAAHDKGIVHRDLKPENLFITKDGRLKILDFGLAKLRETEQAHESALPTVASGTDPGVVLGTVGYMSPEQVRGQSVDHRSDIFAFGAILYEMLSGSRAFQRDSAVETMSAILKEEPPDLSARCKDIPQSLERIVRRCLEKQTERRFRSAADLGFALETLSSPSAVGAVLTATPARSRRGRFALSALVVLVFGALAVGLLNRRSNELQTPVWNGNLLVGGSTIAFGPRVSPDGKTVAFLVTVDGQTQLAVLQVNSGDWEVRTSDRSAGTIRNSSWNSDGSRIFFDRIRGDGDRVFSIPPVGGEERLILENAKIVDSLPDGSVLVSRAIAGRYQLHRFWPETTKVESLQAFPIDGLFPAARAVPGGNHAVFYGHQQPADTSTAPAQLYRIDLTTKDVVSVAPNLELVRPPKEYTGVAVIPLAISPDGRSALVDLPSGDLHRIVAVPLDRNSVIRTLLTLTTPPLSIDVGADGSIYLDQPDTRLEVVRTAVNGAVIEHLVKSTVPPEYCSAVLSLPDGRVLFPAKVFGREKLLVASVGKEPKPFAGTMEESGPPLALAGADQVAFLLGRRTNQVIAIASAADGRLTRRLDLPTGTQISCLAVSPDGRAIYYISNRNLWMIPSTGGESRKLVGADAVALNPKTAEIVVQRNETGGARFFRFDAPTGREQRIEIRDAEAPPSGAPLSSSAIAPDGRIVFPIALPDQWDWEIGLLDPLSRSLKRVPMNYAGGLNSPGWTSDGRIVFTGAPLQSSIWRFEPVSDAGQKR
jgi:serine/threonine protein kinase